MARRRPSMHRIFLQSVRGAPRVWSVTLGAPDSSRFMSASPSLSGYPAFETLQLKKHGEFVLEIALNRPEKSNAMNKTFWAEMVTAFTAVSEDADTRAVLLTGNGKNYTAGLDLSDHMDVFSGGGEEDTARRAYALRRFIAKYQEAFSVIERCPKPVIAAIHSACVGGGVDMISACDIRFCSADAWFCIKEVEIGLAADVGTLQRLPKIVGNDSLVRELALTARRFTAEEALSMGFVSKVLLDQPACFAHALETAKKIAAYSPVAIVGTKAFLNYSRDHTTQDSLDFAANWNMSMLQTEDLGKSVQAGMTKTPAAFSKL